MILFTDGTGARLYAVASRGFSESGVGAEVAVGEGLIGVAASNQRPVRVAHMDAAQRMAEAVRQTAREQGQAVDEAREVPLPGLGDVQSQLAVPMIAQGRTLGVLCVQSNEPGRLIMADERALATLSRVLTTSIVLLGRAPVADAPSARSYAGRPAEAGAIPVPIRYHAADDSIFIDDEYLIKGLPGRILFRLLSVYERDGRVDFTNKELRVDPSLKLGGYRDNLEARLILLRRRLEERCSTVLRLARTGRGRFRLELGCPVRLVQ
jgi:adenylate cyclase